MYRIKTFPEGISQSQFIHSCSQTLRDIYTYIQTTGQGCKMQVPGRLYEAGGCLLTGRDHAQLSARCPSRARESPPGACSRRAAHQPHPFVCTLLLTSVKKPAIPAWHEPCSSPYFFLYSGWEKRRKQTMVIRGMAHALYLSHLHCHMHSLERHQHAGLLGLSTDLPPMCTMAASSPTSGVKARGLKPGGQPACCQERC